MNRVMTLGLILLLHGCSSRPSADDDLKRLPASCNQVLIVRGATDSIQAELIAMERCDGEWQVVLTAPATVGRTGLAKPDAKREGDGKTPQGTFKLETAFGYADRIETGLNYRRATAVDLWIDDPESPDYNRWVIAPTAAKSFEEMKRKDDLYELGAVIEYNTDPVVAGHGSAIFLHVWSGPDKPTAGCVALEKETLRSVLRWLNQKHAPRIIIRAKS
jgi:L,D-peptidoglycan transpeptidase YkuD (ErfK/YbiS/YcfS/YnhG family)